MLRANPTLGVGGPGAGAPADRPASRHLYTNRLIHSRDPYLLLHAHNPVDWYPWGAEALAKAKEENKPIFVSIGYSTCYWCHVAERTIYSNPEIAKLMNQWFINIKVDREQRPDIDRIYMLATVVITGRGAWPNNVFLTPDLKPFFAGSYFPPRDDPAGNPGFPAVLTALHTVWAEHRTDKVLPVAERVFAAMEQVRNAMTPAGRASLNPSGWLVDAGKAMGRTVDPKNGGFGDPESGTKFPQASKLELLVTDYRLHRTQASLDVFTRTLDAMALGGIRDQLAGGFHRYATEPTWSIPHFEKMLYDNAQLLQLYAEAYALTKQPLYRAVALETGVFLGRGLMAREGGFYTALDSQVDGMEGATYVWTHRQIEEALGEKAAKRFLSVYDLTRLPGARAQARETGGKGMESGVLRVREPAVHDSKHEGARDVVGRLAALGPERASLLAARNRRQQPARDDKIVTGLNGLAIGALARSGSVLERPDFTTWARMAAERILALAFDPKSGALQHQIFGGQAETDGYLQDYALLGRGFMALFDATGETRWRDRAAALAAALLGRFAGADGTLSDTPDEKNLLLTLRDSEDRDMPSGTSAAVDLLLRLGAATGDIRYEEAAARILRQLGGQLDEQPDSLSATVVAVSLHPLNDTTLSSVASTPAAWDGRPGIGPAFSAPDTGDHVRVSAVLKSGSDEDQLVVTLTVDDGYHINANPASFDYLIPTGLAFDNLAPVRIDYPKAVRFQSAFAPDGLDVYEGRVALVAAFAKGSLTERTSIAGTVTAQACDRQSCLPPAKLPISVSPPGK